jgi:hypothetical protein
MNLKKKKTITISNYRTKCNSNIKDRIQKNPLYKIVLKKNWNKMMEIINNNNKITKSNNRLLNNNKILVTVNINNLSNTTQIVSTSMLIFILHTINKVDLYLISIIKIRTEISNNNKVNSIPQVEAIIILINLHLYHLGWDRHSRISIWKKVTQDILMKETNLTMLWMRADLVKFFMTDITAKLQLILYLTSLMIMFVWCIIQTTTIIITMLATCSIATEDYQLIRILTTTTHRTLNNL